MPTALFLILNIVFAYSGSLVVPYKIKTIGPISVKKCHWELGSFYGLIVWGLDDYPSLKQSLRDEMALVPTPDVASIDVNSILSLLLERWLSSSHWQFCKDYLRMFYSGLPFCLGIGIRQRIVLFCTLCSRTCLSQSWTFSGFLNLHNFRSSISKSIWLADLSHMPYPGLQGPSYFLIALFFKLLRT